MDSCGQRFDNFTLQSTAIFEELTIEATVPTPVKVAELAAHDSSFFPVSLTVSIKPLEPKDFTYSSRVVGGNTVYRLVLNNGNAELYSFAVWGRLFERDGEDATPPLTGSSCKNLLNLFVLFTALAVALSTFIIQFV